MLRRRWWDGRRRTHSSPHVLGIMCRGKLERRRAGFSNGMVLVTRTTTYADGAYYFTVALERDAAGKNHDLAIVGGMDAEKLPAGLRVLCQIFGGDVKRARGVGLFHGNVDAADPGAIHAHVSHNVAAGVGYGDVHRLADGSCFLFRRGDDAAGIF